MRFKLKLEFKGEPPFVMPVSYQFDLSECIDKIIHFGSDKFSKWLETNGYLDEQKRFNFFNFSNLRLWDSTQEGDRLSAINPDAEILISLFTADSAKPLFIELFKDKELRFGDKNNKVSLIVKDVEEVPDPEFDNSVDFKVISPLIITDGESNNKVKYLSPEDKNFEKQFFKHLLSKYAEYVKMGLASPLNSDFSKLKFVCKSKPVSRITSVRINNSKQTSIKGYLFYFNIYAPTELINLGYKTGFGENNNMGFGFCEVVSNIDDFSN